MTDIEDQCIICLESLEPLPELKDSGGGDLEGSKAVETVDSIVECLGDADENQLIATLVGCDHVIHDRCIRSWAKNSNTCPICRTTFNEVSLSANIGGPTIDSYAVQDKKQTQEFDLHQWLQENPAEEAEEDMPCPVCGTSERPDILLLCDACDAAYHTHCVGLNHVPSGPWYCIECADFFTRPSSDTTEDSDCQEIAPPPSTNTNNSTNSNRNRNNNRSRPFSRTRARQRLARRQARSVEWQGAWGQIAGRIYDALDIDLDNHEDDDTLEGFRRSIQQREREVREYQEWEQRLQIASRQGARDAFARNIPRAIGERLDIVPVVQETAEERQAWGALDRARQAENSNTSNRNKRKSRSITASPREPVVEEPERKLKRPRTRRLPMQGEASASGPSNAGAASTAASPTATGTPVQPRPTPRIPEGPSFLSSLLKEVEMSTPSDDENVRNFFNNRNHGDAQSPASSPASSPRNSPRSLSLTPPPLPRPSSPSTLSSYVEPVFPKANYSPPRASGDASDSEGRSRPIIRQPRPQRPGHMHGSPAGSRAQNESPTRSDISLEEKERISGIVRAALKPHWRAQELTADQYANINRDVSRKLYEGLRDLSTLDDEAKKSWENKATQEVARAVADLKA